MKTLVELGPAIHAQRPGLAVQLQLLQLAEAGTAGLGGFARCVQQVFRLFTGTGVDMQRQRQIGRTQNAAHQIFDAIRAIDEAAQRLHALLRRRQRRARSIHRHIEQHTGLHLAMGFLQQRHLAGNARFAELGGTLHGATASRLGIHVVAEGGQIAPEERLKIDDRSVELPLTWRMNVVIRVTLRTHVCDMRIAFGLRNCLAETDALDARITVW